MTDEEKRAQAIALERRRWWELAETYRRCVQIARDEWEHMLDLAEQQQHDTALEMRDRTAKGVRATGKEYDADRHIPVPLLTPRDRVQFLKEVAATLLISADRRNIPVTPEATREAQSTKTHEADATGDDTAAALDVEAHELAETGEIVGPQEAALGERRRRTVSHSP